MTALRAVIFDVDGTLADTERDGHRIAFNDAFTAHGLEIAWGPEYYGELLAITGGRRRIAHELRRRGHGPTADALAAELHATKTGLFRDRILAGAVTPRPGLQRLVTSLRMAGIRIGVATTGRREWVQPLVDALLGSADAVVTGDDVEQLKPDPEVYRRALAQLGLRPNDALAVEDSALGLRAAVGAGLATVVVTTDYTAHQDFTSAAAVRAGFDVPVQLLAEDCIRIHSTSSP